LTGAQELRHGPVKIPPGGFSPDVLAATTTAMLLDFAAVRVNPEKAAAVDFKLNLHLLDRAEDVLISVGRGVMVYEMGVVDPMAGANVKMMRPDLILTLFGGISVAVRVEAGAIVINGDQTLYPAFVDLIDPLVPNFPIVTP
jgi:alkyl sulfatase BDS1-like metallo-beta-lactamase superfamily hydrolase